MSADEFQKCVEKIGWGEGELRKRVGVAKIPGRRKIRPGDFTLQQTRCVRFLTINEALRAKVKEGIEHFPELKMLSVRPGNDSKS